MMQDVANHVNERGTKADRVNGGSDVALMTMFLMITTTVKFRVMLRCA
jgi:hypothetical protein